VRYVFADSAHYGVKTIARLEQELAAMAEAPGDVPDIEWGLRQIVFERV
jgi:hypothetical protein